MKTDEKGDADMSRPASISGDNKKGGVKEKQSGGQNECKFGGMFKMWRTTMGGREGGCR